MTADPVPAAARPSTSDRIKAALWFAEHDFGVFSVWSATDAGVCRCPAGGTCGSPGKHPVTQNGFKDATRDPERIRAMLSAGSHPNYGLLPPDGVFVWDVDTDDERSRLAALEARHGALPATLRTDTANGQHVFLRWPESHPRPIRKMFGYVTRWGTGAAAGYVIGPRSVHASGAVYRPVAGALDIATLPEGWAAAALEGEHEPVTTLTVGGALPEPGGRHDWLRDRARYFRGFMDDRTVLRAALMAENARLPQPKTAADVDRAIGRVFEAFPADPVEDREDKVSNRLGDDELGLLGRPASLDFPEPPDAAAFAGQIGELVAELADGTDASLTGLLGATIAFCGALFPGQGYFGRTQTSSPFVALVGESSIGRKGTAMNRVKDAFGDALEVATVNRVVMDGINSGEALVSELSRQRTNQPTEPVIRLLFEEEYATLLASRQREGSNLDPKMRAAFDGGQLSNLRSDQWKVVQPPYWLPALIAITPVELRARLESHAVQSGSANRWLYLPVIKRDNGAVNTEPRFSQPRREQLLDLHRSYMKRTPTLDPDHATTRTLNEYGEHLTTTSVGLARDLTRRFTAIAFRVAMIHALVERDRRVGMEHLERAIALTEYARRGVAWVFGDTVGNPDADLLFRHLQDAGRLTRRAITQQIIRDPIRRQGAIDELLRLGRAQVVNIQTAGRPRTELISLPKAGAFVRFVQGSTVRTPTNAENLHGMHESVLGDAQKVHESRTEGAQNRTEVGAETLPAVITDDAHETIVCHFYADHQTQHRWSGTRWLCPICDPGEDSE